MYTQEAIENAVEEAANIIKKRLINIVAENDFVKDVYEHDMSTLEILNWYRNLYYKEDITTERGLMARAINDLFMEYKDKFR